MAELARLDIDGNRARLALNRPESRNALSIELIDALAARVSEIPEDVSVVVLAGEGPSFCAGMDLKKVLDDEDAPMRLLSALADLCLEIRRLPAVVVGASPRRGDAEAVAA